MNALKKGRALPGPFFLMATGRQAILIGTGWSGDRLSGSGSGTHGVPIAGTIVMKRDDRMRFDFIAILELNGFRAVDFLTVRWHQADEMLRRGKTWAHSKREGSYMKLKAIAALAAVASMTTAPVLASVQSNQVTEGSAVVLRDGKAVIADAGAQLQAGDRVISRDGAVSYSFGTCFQALDGASMATVGGECGDMVSLSGGDVQEVEPVNLGTGPSFGTYFVGALALTTLIAGAVIVADEDDTAAGSPS